MPMLQNNVFTTPNVSTKTKKNLETLGAFGNIRGAIPQKWKH